MANNGYFRGSLMSNNDPKIDILTNNDKLGNAMIRLLKYNAGIKAQKINEINGETKLVILDLHAQEVVNAFVENLRKVKKIPFIIIVGIEKKLEDYDRLFLDGADDFLAPIRLLTHACGKNYFHYFSLPYEASRLIAFLKKKNRQLQKTFKLENFFKGLSTVEELQESIDGPSEPFFQEAGRYAIPEYRRRQRFEGFHGKKDIDSLLAMQFYDLAIAYVKHKSQAKDQDKKNRFNVLLVENNPERGIKELNTLKKNLDNNNGDDNNGPSLTSCLKKIEELFDGYKFWIYPKEADYQFLKTTLNSIMDDPTNKKELENEIFRNVKPIKNTATEANNENGKLSFRKIDLILIDIFLGEEATLSGLDFLSLFTLLYPEIPAFILSGNEDTEIIGETIKGKANYYILKKNIFSLPFIYYKYLDELGALINYIEKPELKRNLIGNIRYWRFKKELLWFGDKCYHMINHSYNHAENDWRIANQILPPILDLDYLEIQGKPLSNEDIYSFCMAVWLHDIGHKGNEHYGEPHEIRDLHGLISAEIFIKQPESYGIFEYNGSKASPYRWATFGHPKTAPQLIRERLATFEAAGHLFHNKKTNSYINKLTILEKISLISIYHKSNFPLDEDDLKKFQKKGKRIPPDCYYDKNKETSPIHLKSISDLLDDQNLLRLTALFRFVDGLDINQNRVGDNTEKSVKKLTIARDISYQMLKLRDEVERIRDTHLKDTGMGRRFFTLFYERIIDDIQKDQYVSKELKKEQRQFLDTIGMDLPLDNYAMLTEYIEFISVQEGHFGLHNSIEELEIEVLPPHDDTKTTPRFRIKYISRKKADILNDKEKVTVKERGQKEGRTIRDHLLGEPEEKNGKKTDCRKNDGYVRRELNSAKEYLRDWFDIDNTKIYLHGSDELYKELPQKTERLESD